ncbi:alcohol dehydrogenase catalytic domain-containing protein [Bradyrhizobium sp. 30]|uniref:alcohol dehydrogenase catalytic domain-containing protein n=1 Tax=Bradyrhizobium sp. 30 TaxID=2782669 RepID=UPI001FF7DACC|nr:alcohol dehydrogenase catalytic domain-containing protein [Bradyrhizobium sp. 30]
MTQILNQKEILTSIITIVTYKIVTIAIKKRLNWASASVTSCHCHRQEPSDIEKHESTGLQAYGKPDQIMLAETPRPTPKPDEILVQVHAAGLNPIDNMIPKGTFKPILPFLLPATLGSDLAGVVVEVGTRVTRFKPGDAVFASIFDLGTGALADCQSACKIMQAE